MAPGELRVSEILAAFAWGGLGVFRLKGFGFAIFHGWLQEVPVRGAVDPVVREPLDLPAFHGHGDHLRRLGFGPPAPSAEHSLPFESIHLEPTKHVAGHGESTSFTF